MSRSEPIDKDQQLEKALDDVAEIEPAFESALLTAAEADTEYEIAYSKAYLAAEGSIQAREAAAKVATARYLNARNDLNAYEQSLTAKLKDRQDAVSARQQLCRADLSTNERF